MAFPSCRPAAADRVRKAPAGLRDRGNAGGGTTSLYRRLTEHPDVVAPLGKELQFLTAHFGRGLRWYRSHFPRTSSGQQTLEATPYYLFHPLAAERAAQVLPDAKFVVLLRDPVPRAYSHYLHCRNLGFEKLSFEQALAAEEGRLSEAENLGIDTARGMRLHRDFSYQSRGLYAPQVQRWFDAVTPRRVTVIKSEDFFHQPRQVMRNLLHFLELPEVLPARFERTKSAGTQSCPMRPATRFRLRETFAADSERVRELLGWDASWG